MSEEPEEGMPFVLDGVTQIEDTEGVVLAEPLVAPWTWTQPLVNFPSRTDWEQVRLRERHPGGVPYGYRATKAKYAEQFQELLDGRTPFPAPVVSSLPARALTFPVPGPVLKLAEFARELSWEVRMQYAQGNMPHAATGRAGALKDLIGLRFGAHPMTDRQAYAVCSRPAGGGTWAWGSVMIWGPDLSPYGGCGITELKDYLVHPDRSADVLKSWVSVIRWQRAEQAAAVKARPKVPAKPKDVG
jgi:hypothetical protein